MKKLFLIITAFSFLTPSFAKEYKLFSPDKKTEVIIIVDSGISITTNYQSEKVFSVDNISMEIENEDFASIIEKNKQLTSLEKRKYYL